MAQRVQTIMVDDLSGDEFTDGETMTFQWRGVTYVIDLNADNVERFEKAVAPFVQVARRDSRNVSTLPGRPSTPRKKTGPDREQLTAIREWARGQGMEVSDRGRVSYKVREAFEEAHSREAMVG